MKVCIHMFTRQTFVQYINRFMPNAYGTRLTSHQIFCVRYYARGIVRREERDPDGGKLNKDVNRSKTNKNYLINEKTTTI